MRIVLDLDESWIKSLLQWQELPDVKEYILGEESLEDIIGKIQRGEIIWLGLEEDGWRGFATLEPHDDQAEVAMFAPGRARSVLKVISTLLKRFPINKIYMKVRLDRLDKWQEYSFKDFQRITRFWGLEFLGIMGDPIGDKPFYIISAKEIEHG